MNIDERVQQEALREFYNKADKKKKKTMLLKKLRHFSLVVNPLVCVGFVIVFWVAGMRQYYQTV